MSRTLSIHPVGRALSALTLAPLLVLAACGSPGDSATPQAPGGGMTASSAPAGSGSSPAPGSSPSSSSQASTGTSESATTESTTEPTLSIEVTLADGRVTPNGQKYDARVGDILELTVTSDHDDEIHIHGIDVEFEVGPDAPVTRQITLTAPGSYEIESHQPPKTIGVLNVR